MKKQIQIHIKKSIGVTLLLAALTLLSQNSFGQCSYGPVYIICHNDPGSTNTFCCGSMYDVCVIGIIVVQNTKNEPNITNPSVGKVLTCGGGDTALSVDGPFTGICGLL